MQTLVLLAILGLVTADPLFGLLGGAGAGHGSGHEQGLHGGGHLAESHGGRHHYSHHHGPSHGGHRTSQYRGEEEHYTVGGQHVRRSVESEPRTEIQEVGEVGERPDTLEDRSGLLGYGYGRYGLGGLGYGFGGLGYGLGGLGYGLGYDLSGYGLGYGGNGLWKKSGDEKDAITLHKSKRSANPYYGLGYGGLYGLGGFGYGFGGLYGHGLYGGHFWKRSSEKEENSSMSKTKRSANPYYGLGYGGLYGLGGYGYGLGGLYGHGLYGGHFWKRSILETMEAKETEESEENASISKAKRSANPYYGLGYGGLYGLGGYGYGLGGLYGHGLYGGHFWRRSTDKDEKISVSKSKRSANPYYGLGLGYGGLYGLGGLGYGFGGLYGHGLYGGHFWKRSTDNVEETSKARSKRSAEPFYGGYGYGGYDPHHHHHHHSHYGHGLW